MARKRTYWHEPWRAAPSRGWEASFAGGPPPVDDPEVLSRWEQARDRAEQSAEWVVWGSDLTGPGYVHSLLGGVSYFDGAQVVAHLRPVVTDNDNPVTHGMMAQRIVACVNACAGIAEPEKAVALAREVLRNLLNKEMDVTDASVLRSVALLSAPPAGSRVAPGKGGPP